jgi:hypothetical protein
VTPYPPPQPRDDSDITLALTQLRYALYAYGLLEKRVSDLLNRRFGACCASCRGDCCHVDICRESLESDWLRLLTSISGLKGPPFDPAQGWRSPTGCRLTRGRPTICYAFFCQHAMDSLPDARLQEIYEEIAGLVPGVGDRALGKRHLVTLTAAEIFGKLNTRRLLRRIRDALDRLNGLAERLGEVPLWLIRPRESGDEIPILLVDVVADDALGDDGRHEG